ncbi:lipoyltransferase [Neolentinus lepideus HHB14362 ss-1]|uniref:lipoyl(octanoyl) transferase n=1 Tax=Neolentinus lepideus HHB14362 ss-1 TaxID=1314782 RepID=A0A165RGN9_9AGAM|nr:lipoyltransferase [Neolentinus lepideus HHB14362 ss-1]
MPVPCTPGTHTCLLVFEDSDINKESELRFSSPKWRYGIPLIPVLDTADSAACSLKGSFFRFHSFPLRMASLPPIFYHYFRSPIPYGRAFTLQEQIHALQLERRRASASYKDILLLLQHTPVYTFGRRQSQAEIDAEQGRLRELDVKDAEFILTQRGGQLTYHGPGQIVGYPLIDLARWQPAVGARDYVCKIQKTLERHLHEEHGVTHIPSEHTGVFLDERTKIASIGVQVRHRLTTHGFAMNITKEPLAYFDKVIACGLVDVQAGCIEVAAKKPVTVEGEVPGLVNKFGQLIGREMVKLDLTERDDFSLAVEQAEKHAAARS